MYLPIETEKKNVLAFLDLYSLNFMHQLDLFLTTLPLLLAIRHYLSNIYEYLSTIKNLDLKYLESTHIYSNFASKSKTIRRNEETFNSQHYPFEQFYCPTTET